MSTVEKRSISLPHELSAMIDRAVEGGEFGNASEVVREALRQWKERRELYGYSPEQLRALWAEGVNSGPARPFSSETAAEIKANARERFSEAAKKGT